MLKPMDRCALGYCLRRASDLSSGRLWRRSVPLSLLWFATMSLVLVAVHAESQADDQAAKDAERVEYFERHIRPVLVEHCYACHSAKADKIEGELLLDSRAGLLAGGVTGKALNPGDPSSSLIIKALKHDQLEMPPDRRLGDATVKHFEKWIQDGAIDPREAEALPPARKPDIDWAAARSFWALKPPKAQTLPDVEVPAWSNGRIDHFVLKAIERNQLRPSQAAERAVLLRRASLDATDLPPNYEDVVAFVQDTRPDAWQRQVDRLLASPAMGQRLARLWLDLARYAEDQAHIVGNDRSLCYPNAYMYRDWVVEAFNADLPYDRFIQQQLAADLMDECETGDLRPLGFLGLGPKYYNRGSPEVMADEWEDRVDVVSRGLLGLTVACARCHDHKYDPIPTEDYYALAGVFASTSMFNRPLKEDCEKKDSGEAKKPEEALHVVRDGKPTDLQVMIRGDVKRKGALAPRGFLTALSAEDAGAWKLDKSSGRRELAESIASPNNPLVARVFVNRIWGALVGRPLVTTTSNFGRLGSEPSHPELLDDLAVRFVEADWSLKWLLRTIMTSSVYQQSSKGSPNDTEVDPDNVWLARMHRKRLSVEAWRDSILKAAGSLDRSMGGPSMNPQDPESHRRTLYSEVSRLEVNKMLALFDFPDPNVHAERRTTTTTALQKLFVLNSPFMLEQAKDLAENICSQAGTPAAQQSAGVADRIAGMLRLAYARDPSPAEADALVAFALSSVASGKSDSEQATEVSPEIWQQIAHVLLASNELLFVD